MKDLLEFLEGIGNAITGVIDFVISFVQDLVYIVTLVTEFVIEIPIYFSWLPSAAVTVLVFIFGIVVIYKIAGREG